MSRPSLSQVLDELKKDYLVSFPDKLDKLKQLAIKNDLLNLSEEFHKLKGTGKTYGYAEVSSICEQLESLSKTTHPDLNLLINDGISVLEKLYQHYSLKTDYNFSEDPVAQKILAIQS